MAKLEDLLRDAGASQEEIDATVLAFNPDRLQAIERATMRQADYSRNLDKVKSDWNVANAEYIRMQNDFSTTQAERDAAKAEVDRLKTKVAETEVKVVDTSKFLTDEQLRERETALATSQTAYFADILEIAPEHQELFGSRLNTKEFIQKAMAAGKAPYDYWNETYNPQAKRDEREAAKKTEWEASIRRDEAEKVRSSMVPGARPLEESRSPFWEPQGEEKQPWDSGTTPKFEADLLGELSNVGR